MAQPLCVKRLLGAISRPSRPLPRGGLGGVAFLGGYYPYGLPRGHNKRPLRPPSSHEAVVSGTNFRDL
eukprot:10896-Pyramimonas_sp.AAC.1